MKYTGTSLVRKKWRISERLRSGRRFDAPDGDDANAASVPTLTSRMSSASAGCAGATALAVAAAGSVATSTTAAGALAARVFLAGAFSAAAVFAGRLRGVAVRRRGSVIDRVSCAVRCRIFLHQDRRSRIH